MIVAFWTLAFGLALVAVAFVLTPLYLRRGRRHSDSDRTQVNVSIFEERMMELDAALSNGDIDAATHEQMKLELQKNLLVDTDRGESELTPTTKLAPIPLLLAILVPVFAIVAYSELGLSWGSIGDLELSKELRNVDPHDASSVDESIQKLADRLEAQPQNDEGWYLLAQSYMAREKYGEAATAFRHLADRYPGDVDLSTSLAQAMYLADGRILTTRVDEVLARVLGRDPGNVTALEIRAMDAYTKRDYEGAVAYFRRALAGVADDERSRLIRSAITGIEREHNLPASDVESGRAIDVTVDAADTVQVDGDAPVFIFVRAVDGPPMPLAARRVSRRDLPVRLTLDESMAMAPGVSLSSFDSVMVVARISTTGGVNPSADDYEAKSENIDLTAKSRPVVQLVITRKVASEPSR